jgi:hypothetical protein
MKNLTPTQYLIIDNLIAEFTQMNAPIVSTGNPLLDILKEFHADKKAFEENEEKFKAKRKALRDKIYAELQMVQAYFDELGYNVDCEVNNSLSNKFITIRFRIDGSTFLGIDGFVEYKQEMVGEFIFKKSPKIVFEMEYYNSTAKYDSINDLLKSGLFKERAMRLINKLEELKNN